MGSSKKEISMEEAIDSVSGTWINEEYVTSMKDAKLVFNSNGTIASFYLTNQSNPNASADLTIEDTWIDSKGNIWFKALMEPRGFSPYFCLFRISDSGKTLEYMYSSIDYPEKIVTEPEEITTTYVIYYRQE
jgi:GH43 family beta-xylosidase